MGGDIRSIRRDIRSMGGEYKIYGARGRRQQRIGWGGMRWVGELVGGLVGGWVGGIPDVS